ncbi:MAG: 2,5-diamino-6-(ribosylamino)-4(3H)-pyrimidinone 5'-phosphate reductase [Candidatus Bathyarchaeia archaeon]
MSGAKRPYVILNAAMTLDGKIASRSGDSRISCEEDLGRVHRLRANVDAIMIGINTLLVDDPKLTARRVNGRNPVPVIVDSQARTPPNSKFLSIKRERNPIIAVAGCASKRRIEVLKEAGCEVIVTGRGRRVNLSVLMDRLWKRGIQTVLLEGGGTLIWSMVKERLIDEVKVAIAPIMLGGVDAVTLVEGKGYASISDALKLEFLGMEVCGEDVVLSYKVRSGG